MENLSEACEIERSLPHGHVRAVLGSLRRLGLDRILHSRRSRQRDLIVALIVARIVAPASKLATANGLEHATFGTLADELELEDVNEDDLYKAMDWLLPRQDAIETRLARRHLREGSLALYDLTSSCFEGRTCPLAKLGHSRDKKKGKAQITIGLICDARGCPVAVEVFEGNTADPTTFSAQVIKVRERFGLKRVVFVGDRGMITSARIREDLENQQDVSWITALRAKQIQRLVQQGSLQLSLFDEFDLGEVTSPEYPGERLIACRNPLLADERERKREELLQATESDLDKIVVATRRARKPLRGQSEIGLRVGRVLGRYKMAKHFLLEIEEDSFSYRRDEEKIAREQALDGVYMIRTSVPAEAMGTTTVVRAYKSLSHAERAFRTMKTIDLKMRPIHHRLEDRVRAHVFLCMLAYYVEWHMTRALAPLLFVDEEPEGDQLRHKSIVAPAQRSASALSKASSKKNSRGEAVHSFRGLLAHLGTLTKNLVRPKIKGSAPFEQTTRPDPLQQRVFDLLEENCRPEAPYPVP
ncbi:MAG: IS1634 family transposase [Acidobacteriota bacterium]|nr:IS1634 family transposase [Acidobacteriota bacterium]